MIQIKHPLNIRQIRGLLDTRLYSETLRNRIMNYDENYVPAMLTLSDRQAKIFRDSDHLSDFFQRCAEEVNCEEKDGKVTVKANLLDENSLGLPYHGLFSLRDQVFYSPQVANMKTALLLCRAIEEAFPELEDKLVFMNHYGEIAQFKFGEDDDSLYKRIGLDPAYLDHAFMKQNDLE